MAASILTITVRFHGVLRQITGRAVETLALPAGTSLQGSLERLVEEHGPALGSLLLDPEGTLSSQFVLFRNGKLTYRAEAESLLAEGDELMLFPRVSGG